MCEKNILPDTTGWELTLCNVMLASVNPSHKKLFANDIVTGKPIRCVYKDTPHDVLWQSVEGVIGTCMDKGLGLPAGMFFYGHRRETDKFIEYNWETAKPCFAANGFFSVACYVKTRTMNGQVQFEFCDVLTDKPILFQGLESNCNLMNSIQMFARSDGFLQCYGKGREVLVMQCGSLEHMPIGIAVDANTVFYLADKNSVHKRVIDNIIGSVNFGQPGTSA